MKPGTAAPQTMKSIFLPSSLYSVGLKPTSNSLSRSRSIGSKSSTQYIGNRFLVNCLRTDRGSRNVAQILLSRWRSRWTRKPRRVRTRASTLAFLVMGSCRISTNHWTRAADVGADQPNANKAAPKTIAERIILRGRVGLLSENHEEPGIYVTCSGKTRDLGV